MQQRDAFLTEIYKAAVADPAIMLLSADFGAPALDEFRAKLPAQFIHCGISEQNMVNVAVGLALAGKRPYVYAMSPFFLRCAEQLKLAAIHKVPLTVVSVGAGLSYAGSGPTHYATEDVAFYRTLVDAEVYTASTNNLAAAIARLTVSTPRFRVVRLERGDLPELYPDNYDASPGYEHHRLLEDAYHPHFVTSGYLVHWMRQRGSGVTDLYRVHPAPVGLARELRDTSYVYTADEQYCGGVGSAVLESVSAYDGNSRPFVVRRYLRHVPLYANGTRDQLLEEYFL
jgi:transketolase